MRSLAVASLLLLLAPDATPGRRVAVSEQVGSAFAARLGVVESRWRSGQPQPESPFRVSEAELNSWISYELRLPEGLSDVEIRLERDRLSASGLLDLEQVQGRIPRQEAAVAGLLSLLSGTVRCSVSGRLLNDAEPGFGSLELEQVSLGAVPLSPAALAPMVAAATRSASRPSGFDILAPFRYPYGVKRIRLRAGRALLEF